MPQKKHKPEEIDLDWCPLPLPACSWMWVRSSMLGRGGLLQTAACVPISPSPVQHSFDDEGEAVGLFLQLLRAKRMRGYQAIFVIGRSVDYSILELLETCSYRALGKEMISKKAQTSAAGSLSK